MKRATPILVTGTLALRAPTCPACGAAVALQATVEEFGKPAAWHFWGRAGERWAKCRGERNGIEFVHFMTLLNGAYSHRLAWIKRQPVEVEAEQARLF